MKKNALDNHIQILEKMKKKVKIEVHIESKLLSSLTGPISYISN